MNPIRLYIALLLFLSFNFRSAAQRVEFSKIEYASFDVNSYRTPEKNKAFIALYSEIDSNGMVRINRNDNYKNKNNYLSRQLSEAELKKLTALFKINKALKISVKEYKFKDGENFYAGSYEYFVVTYKNGVKDSICTIPPFMLKTFAAAYSMLSNFYYGDKKKKATTPFIPTAVFKDGLYKSYLKNKFLPAIKTLPSFRPEDLRNYKQD